MALSAQRESSGIDLLTCLGNAIKEVVETFLPDALFGGQVSITKPSLHIGIVISNNRAKLALV